MPKSTKQRRVSTGTRKVIWLRDKGRCRYCGVHCIDADTDAVTYKGDVGTIDHVIPRLHGGASTWYENLVLSCSRCNQYKASCTPEMAGMELLPIGTEHDQETVDTTRLRPRRPYKGESVEEGEARFLAMHGDSEFYKLNLVALEAEQTVLVEHKEKQLVRRAERQRKSLVRANTLDEYEDLLCRMHWNPVVRKWEVNV